MNVKELKKMLKKYPDDMEIVTSRCSDYQIIKEDEWEIIEGVPNDHWVMEIHRTMSEENKSKVQKYLHLEGN